jgi:hypothetical protein
MLGVQTSFADVKCINAGALPLPAHGRQLVKDETVYKTEEVGQKQGFFCLNGGHGHTAPALHAASWTRHCALRWVQEREQGNITHIIGGFGHKVFSLCYATSFDEVGAAAHTLTPACMSHLPMHARLLTPSWCPCGHAWGEHGG